MQQDNQIAFNDKAVLQCTSWRAAALYALPIAGLVLALFYYWFAVADRYTVFLYYHDMGPLVPDTAPFSTVTASRYWMAGLVASGLVLVLHSVGNGIAGRFVTRYQPPVWWRVWVICAAILLTGIPAITMTQNQPTLPLWNTVQVTIVTLVGLAFALLPGDLAARQPGQVALLAVDGWGFTLILTALSRLDMLGRWIASDNIIWVWMVVVLFVAGVGWLVVTSLVHILWIRQSVVSGSILLFAGFTVAYLLMPLVHHIMGTNGYFYITNSDNFFSQRLGLQVIAWAIAAALAYSVAQTRQKLQRHRA